MIQHNAESLDSAITKCERQVIEFMAHFDAQAYAKASEIFAPDGVWRRPDGVINGREDFLSRMAQRPRGLLVRHVITNLRSRLLEPEKVVVESYVTVYRHDFSQEILYPAPLSGPAVVGRYKDVLSHVDGTWLISEKSVLIDFKK